MPEMFDQFLICRRCIIFFKTRKFRTMHNIVNHRKKKQPDKENIPKRRRRNRSDKEPLICDLCSKSFKIKALIRSHMNCHSSEKPLQCNLCSYAAKRNYDLKKHHFVHHNPDRIVAKKRIRRKKCDKCDEILPGKAAFKLHMRLNHPKEKLKRKPRIYKKCEKCEEAIHTKKGYKLHMKQMHRGFMYIQCDKCNRRFKTNFRLRKHQARYCKILIILFIQIHFYNFHL